MFLRREVLGCLGAVLAVAATGGSAQQAIDARALVGVWQGMEQTGNVVIRGEIQFFDSGYYQRSFIVGSAMGFHSGVWSVAGSWLHFEVRDYEPKVVAGYRQAPPPSETWVLRRFDGSVLQANVGITQVTYQRVR